MQIFDRIDPGNLDRRELHLWILALTVILIQATGVGLWLKFGATQRGQRPEKP
jgi:hypothetical protein